MNLFWKRLFGSFTPTAKFEEQYSRLTDEFRRYVAVRESRELSEYNELFQVVKSSEFKEKKNQLKTRKYSDTEYYRDMTKFKKLEADGELKHYFKVLDSPILREYLAFKEKPEFLLLGKPDEVKKSPELTRLKEFERSKDYHIYTRFFDSFKVKEYNTLRDKVNTLEFQQQNEFWADAHRWEKTAECEQEKRFFELSKNEDIIFFLKHDPKKFALLDKYQEAFVEEFEWNSLPKSKWEYGFNYGKPELFGRHSIITEKQANNNGNNVAVMNGHLHILTKEEKKTAVAWHPTKGFLEKEYEYTSDVIHGKNAVCQKGGIFAAKMRFSGSSDVTHAFWLSDGTHTPHINICVSNGKEVEVGIHWNSKFERKYTSTRVKGLNLKDFHVFTLIWNETELIWYINNYEVFRTSNFMPIKPMFPMLNSFISGDKKGGAADFEIDYVRAYSLKDKA